MDDTVYRIQGDGRRLDVLLSEKTGLSRSRVASLMADGCCRMGEKRCEKAGMKAAPDDNWWAFYNEEDAEVAPIRYAKTHEERLKACEDWFPYQYACWKGLKKAFDERGMKLMYAPTHGSCNYNQEWRREMMDLFMEIAASHGFRYDFIAIHTYYAVDNSYLGCFDRDANAAALLSRMEKLGYGDAPVMFSEGFNALPFSIPRFGALASADNYINGGPASLDLGWREFPRPARWRGSTSWT
jgi:hypothetical protein